MGLNEDKISEQKENTILEKSDDSLVNEENIDNSAKLAEESNENYMDNDDSEIILESKEGKLELIFSKTLLFLDKDDKLSIKLPKKGNNWVMKFHFTEDDNKGVGSSRYVINDGEGKIAHFYFNKWHSVTWIENSQPFHLMSKSGSVELFVKTRGTSESSRHLRHLTISVWRKIK